MFQVTIISRFNNSKFLNILIILAINNKIIIMKEILYLPYMRSKLLKVNS